MPHICYQIIVTIIGTISLATPVSANATLSLPPESAQAQQEFRQWLGRPDAKLAQQYLSYLQQHTTLKLQLFELTYNRHPATADCAFVRFAIPPQHQWRNLVPALLILDQLHQQRLIEQPRIISVYRDAAANRCIRGSQRSKHLSHHAIDFQVSADAPKQPISTTARLCQFWRQHGKALQMGLGVYGLNRFHVDASGYRTWELIIAASVHPAQLIRTTRQAHQNPV